MKNKVAILLRGSISKQDGAFSTNSGVYRDDEYINFYCAFNSIKKHIIDTNNRFDFDFFIQSWNLDLENNLKNLYKPLDSIFEDNNKYKDLIYEKLQKSGSDHNLYNQVSQALSIKIACELVENYSKNNGIIYDRIILYRPDLLLWKDLVLDEYDERFIYCNNFLDRAGDFHFVFSPNNLNTLKGVFDSISHNNQPTPHNLIKNHIIRTNNATLKQDSIKAGIDQEVIRKLAYTSLRNGSISPELLSNYGITKDEILKYKQ